MGTVKRTDKLKGDYGELIFEHFSQYNKYAYLTLEEIYKNLTPSNKLIFRMGYRRIEIHIPEEIVEEVRKFCVPTRGGEDEPAFVYDYFTARISDHKFSYDNERKTYIQKNELILNQFSWVEIKTGKSTLTRNQKEYMEKSKVGVCIFRIPAELPGEIAVEWDEKYHPERHKKNDLS